MIGSWEEYQKDPNYERVATKLCIKDSRTIKRHVIEKKSQLAEEKERVSPPASVQTEMEQYPLLFQDLENGKSEIDLVITRKIAPELARKAFQKYHEAMGALVLSKEEKERIFRALNYYNTRVDLIENGTWTFEYWANDSDMMCHEIENLAKESEKYDSLLAKFNFPCTKCGRAIYLRDEDFDSVKSAVIESGMGWHHRSCDLSLPTSKKSNRRRSGEP